MSDIIIRQNDINFRLAKVSVEEVENARVSLTDLAHLLGYRDKSMLKRLAENHSEPLGQLGPQLGSVTATVPIRAGNAPIRFVEELAFNQPQVMYLVGHADTTFAKVLHVQYVKGFFMLLNYVRAEEARAAAPPQQLQLPKPPILQSLQTLQADVVTLLDTLQRAESCLETHAAAINVLNTEVAATQARTRVHDDAIRDLRADAEERDSAHVKLVALARKQGKAAVKEIHKLQKLQKAQAETPAAVAKADKPAIPSRPAIPNIQTMQSIRQWARRNKPANAPVAHTSLGRVATRLYWAHYKQPPVQGESVLVHGVSRQAAIYPEFILREAFLVTPRTKRKKKAKST